MPKVKNISESVTPTETVASTLNVDAKSKIQQFIKEETKLVKGRFRCFETPGSSHRIQVRKYKDIPMFDRWMTDGEVYEIPLYVARHLNGVDVTAGAINGKIGTCSYPVHGFKCAPGSDMPPPSSPGFGPNGEPNTPAPISHIIKRVRRFGFESLEFDTDVS